MLRGEWTVLANLTKKVVRQPVLPFGRRVCLPALPSQQSPRNFWKNFPTAMIFPKEGSLPSPITLQRVVPRGGERDAIAAWFETHLQRFTPSKRD